MVRTNATITLWQSKSGNDKFGQPTFTDHALSLPVISEPKTVRLKIGEREVVCSLRVHIPGDPRSLPAIKAGDRVTVDGRSCNVMEALTASHPTLGHLTLLLMPLQAGA